MVILFSFFFQILLMLLHLLHNLALVVKIWKSCLKVQFFSPVAEV